MLNMSVIKLLQLVIGVISVHRSQPSWDLINKVFAVCGLNHSTKTNIVMINAI